MSNIQLGAFSISLAVKDIHVSKAFYEKLGFVVSGGNIDQNWLILKNEIAVIGLFQGMFEQNIMTFNPGWNQNAEMLTEFTDIRAIAKHLSDQNISMNETPQTESGPAYITLTDPDGNSILIDQHR